MSIDRFLARNIALTLMAGLPLLASSGCHEDNLVANLKLDDAFIQLPGEVDHSIEPGPGSPFPLKRGDHWTMFVSSADRHGKDEVTDLGPMTVAGETGEAIEVRGDSTTTAPVRIEVYRSDDHGLLLVASGTSNNMMRMSPPIPLYRMPMQDGDTLSWNGLLQFKNSSSVASALSRVTGRNEVTTPAGTFKTYRVDTIITATINEQPVAFPMTRWLAPGVGLVQQRLLSGQTIVTKQLGSYSVAKN